MAAFYTFGVPIDNSRLVKIGILSLNDVRLEKLNGLKDHLKMFDYEEGKSITYMVLNANSDISKLPSLAEQLVINTPDVLVAAGAGEARALVQATSGLENPPAIIFMGTVSPKKLGLIENEAHPTANVTGLDNYHLDLNPKRLEIIHRMLPHVKTVALLGDQRMSSFETAHETLANVARELNIKVNTYTVSNSEEISQVFKELILVKTDAIMLLSGFFLETSTEEIVELATDKGIPVFGVYPSDAEKGCLASYGTSYYSQGAQSAEMVHKVLMGYSPKNIPVETPDKLTFVVNLQTAKRLDIHLTPNILCLADQVIQPK
ncbi:MAG: ABC transporter substrate-binding protein [Desulfitobacterium hafniense]|nr:ABC transporter substrate-binding protein [Desulfitobacterium hafniense]